jgi:hypothetical protein
MLLLSQRGAMFGLDGRISTAIFMALAAVVGVVGYSKLTTAQNSAFIKDLMAYDEAYQALQSDMGVFVEEVVNLGSDGTKDVQMLWDDAQVDSGYRRYWTGPYITAETLSHKAYGTFSISYGQDDMSPCDASNACYAWLSLTNVPAAMWDKANDYFDENNNSNVEGAPASAGRLRANSAVADPRTLHLRTVKRPGS